LPGGDIHEAGRARVDWLTFVDHLIGHLAWPLIVAGLVVFLSLRHRVAMDALLHRVRKAKAGPFEAELDEAKAAAEAAGLPSPDVEKIARLQRPTTDEPEAWLDYLGVLADVDPRSAVQQAYHFLNHQASEVTKRLYPDRAGYRDGEPSVARAAAVGLLPPEHVDVLDRLREAALSVHDPDVRISSQQARDYVLLIARLVTALRERLH